MSSLEMRVGLILFLFACAEAFDVDSVLGERVRAGLHGEGCLDTCFNETALPNMCACDSSCHLRRDCCADLAFGVEEGEPRLRCVFSSGKQLMTVANCPASWNDSETRLVCEQGKTRSASYLQDIPVYSESSGVFYRNTFCALCNGDVERLSRWSVLLDCVPDSVADALRNGTANSVGYSAGTKNLAVRVGRQRGSCRIAVKEILRDDFYDAYNVSRCSLPPVRKCPSAYKDDVIRTKCESYTAMVYDPSKLLRYRNYHCALCNGRTVKTLECKPHEDKSDSRFEQFGTSYAIVMDFSQFEMGGGGSRRRNSMNQCEPREVYDPVLNSCLAAACPLGRTWTNGKCVSTDREDKPSEQSETEVDCEWVFLPSHYIRILADGSGLVTHRNITLAPTRYQVTNGSDRAVACIPLQVHFKLDTYQGILSRVVLTVSILCLIMHIAVYAALSQLRNRPGKILLCLSISVLLAQVTFLAGSEWTQGTRLCYGTAVMSHLFHLAAFFWMNALAIDVHRTFRSSGRPPSATSAFLKYSLYGTLGPTAIVLTSGLVGYFEPASEWSPSYGTPFCWINRPWALAAYFIAPIFLLLLVNAVLLGLTVASIHMTDKQVKLARKEQQQRSYLYAKLAVVFGLTWVFGFAAAFTNMQWMWYPFIIFCGLQGAFIFVSFTCKRSVSRLLRQAITGKKAGRPRADSSNLTSMRTSIMTSSTALASIVRGIGEKDLRRATPTQSREGTPLIKRASAPPVTQHKVVQQKGSCPT
ncbi:uncharacterized protein LOC135393524 [Ornithodoros turicata]|uniref:uncharacterized protein LOC135393524 n=1 Tax=Ornithodoros turicata TaxID=34597 RepID=UPI0031398F6F